VCVCMRVEERVCMWVETLLAAKRQLVICIIYSVIRLTLYAATASAPSYAMLHSMPFRFKRMESILQLDTASDEAKPLKR
jgi:hypothetical protein